MTERIRAGLRIGRIGTIGTSGIAGWFPLLALAALLIVPRLAASQAGGALRVPAPPLENSNPDSTVLVIPMDGRPAQEVPRIHRGGESYVPLGELACALGVPFAWNPFSYQGWIATDSIRTAFTLDSPVLSHGPDEAQIASEIAYDAHGVLLPLDYLALLGERWHGKRAVTWRPGAGILHWGTAAPTFRQLRISQAGNQSVLKIPMREHESPSGQSLFWSPVGRLDILLDGVSATAESLSVRGLARGSGLLVRDVGSTPGGCRIRLEIGRDVLGASAGYDSRENAWELSTTTSRVEIGHGGFRGLMQADRSGWDLSGAPGPVVITAIEDPAGDPAEADSALSDLADSVARTLADTLLMTAQVVNARDPVDVARSANAGRARCVIALRLDRYPSGAGKLQIWSAMPRLRWEPVDLTQSLQEMPPRPLLWSETPALAEGTSRRLVSNLKAHLGALVGGDRVVSGARPSRWLEGFTMPTVLIYPAQADDPLSIEWLRDDAQRAELARAIAFAVSEAIVEPGTGPTAEGRAARPIGMRGGPER